MEGGKEKNWKASEVSGLAVRRFFLIEDLKLLVRFSGFVCVFSYPKHAVYQCLQ